MHAGAEKLAAIRRTLEQRTPSASRLVTLAATTPITAADRAAVIADKVLGS